MNENGSISGVIRDWLPMITLVVSGLVWGMKLEGNILAINATLLNMEQRLGRVEAQIGAGILPRAEEKITAVEARMAAIERCADRIDAEHAALKQRAQQ